MSIETIAADVQAHLWVYLSIPLIAGLIGYVTKMLAMKMMFHPQEFIGIKPPYLGWQGVVPRKATKMATVATQLLVGTIIKPEELMARLDPERMIREMERPLMAAAQDLVTEVGERFMPSLWHSTPTFARRALIARVQREIPAMVEALWADMAKDIDRYLDIQHLLVSSLTKDKALLGEIFKKVGAKEFVFFRNAGFWLGFVLGIVQLGCWIIWHQPWMIPLFGGIVGLISDYVVLQMLFRPLQPKMILGLTVQGQFIARQKEVARDYAELISKELLTPAHIVEEMLNGPLADQLIDQIQRQVRDATERQLGVARPFVVMAMSSERYNEIRKFMVDRIIKLIPETSREMERYALDALDIKNTIADRMDRLTPQQFEGLLRPAFKEDEPYLIVCGAVLGFLIGELQAHLMLS